MTCRRPDRLDILLFLHSKLSLVEANLYKNKIFSLALVLNCVEFPVEKLFPFYLTLLGKISYTTLPWRYHSLLSSSAPSKAENRQQPKSASVFGVGSSLNLPLRLCLNAVWPLWNPYDGCSNVILMSVQPISQSQAACPAPLDSLLSSGLLQSGKKPVSG